MSDTTPDESRPTPAPQPLSVGASLRSARAKTGKSLSEVANLLRIRQPYLLALEEGRHKDLPGGAYAIGFLRTYADFLALDGEEMVRRFRAEASDDLNPRSELVFPSPVSEGRIPGGAVLFVGLLLAGLAYGAWYLVSSRDSSVAEMVPTLPERLSSVLNRPANITSEVPPALSTAPAPSASPSTTATAEPEATKTAESAAKDSEVVPPSEDEDAKPSKPEEMAKVAAPSKSEPAKSEATKPNLVKAEPAKPLETKAPEPVKAEPVKTEPTKPVDTPKPAEMVKAPEQSKAEQSKPEPAKAEAAKPIPAADLGDSRVQLTAAADDCWIQVREMDGQLLMSKLLRKGDSYVVPNRPGLSLMVGNAGALDVVVDGKRAPSLGAAGQVRRDIRLDPDKLLGG